MLAFIAFLGAFLSSQSFGSEPTTVTTSAELQDSLLRTVIIQSKPDSCYVILDRSLSSHAPCSLRVSPGKHLLMLSRNGYTSYSDTVEIISDTTFSFRLEGLSTIIVMTTERGIPAFVDSVYIGNSPLTASVRAGEYSLGLRHPLYEDWLTILETSPMETVVVFPKLALRRGRVVFSSGDEPVSVAVDSQIARGKGELSMSVSAGLRFFDITSEGKGRSLRLTAFVLPDTEMVFRIGFAELSLPPALPSLFVPGSSQMIRGSFLKGGLFFSAFGTSFGFTMNALKVLDIDRDSYYRAQGLYDNAATSGQALVERKKLADAHTRYKESLRIAWIGGGIAAAVYILNAIDALTQYTRVDVVKRIHPEIAALDPGTQILLSFGL